MIAPGRPHTVRVPDWTERLAEVAAAAREAPFAWGTNDCVMFAADVALAITGRDPGAPWRGRYASEEEAQPLIEAHGGLDGLAAFAMEMIGAPEILPVFAQRGDWALVDLGNEVACGVVLDGDRVGVPGMDGLRHTRLSRALRAWAI